MREVPQPRAGQLAVLKADGRLATVMPHGVLFRGGEEREARQYFIDKGYISKR